LKLPNCLATVIVGKLADSKYPEEVKMLTESELPFVRSVLANPPKQRVEEVASQSLETNRIPDTYIYKVVGGKFYTPGGVLIEEKIDKSTILGQTEFVAFQEIQKWADGQNGGFCVWFSPPYPEIYPVSKIIIQEIGNFDNQKMVINRAIVLDNDSEELLDLAQQLTQDRIENSEYLRITPIFPDRDKFISWFQNLALYTNQVDLIKNGVDVDVKTDTYAKLSDIEKSVSIAGQNQIQDQIYQVAYKQGLIGSASESCPKILKTVFNAVYEDSIVLNPGESKYVKNCGNCGTTIESVISKGYRCKSCGGEYKGC